jgi:hypothetical protein
MGATFFLRKLSRLKTGPNKPPSQGVLGVHSLRVNRQMREADHSPTPSKEKKNVWSYSSNPHVPSRREQVQLYLYFTTNVENSRSLQRSSCDCCKSRSNYRLDPQPTTLAAGIAPSDSSWPSASKCLLTQDPFSSLTIHFNSTVFCSRSGVTSRTILNSINQSKSGVLLHQLFALSCK